MTCPNCQHRLDPMWRHCSECGAFYTIPITDEERAQIRAEARREAFDRVFEMATACFEAAKSNGDQEADIAQAYLDVATFGKDQRDACNPAPAENNGGTTNG